MKKLRFILLACMLSLLFATGCGKKKPTEIDPSGYFSITFSGYDGYGSFASLDFDVDSMLDDYEDAIGEARKNRLIRLIGKAAKAKLKNDFKYSNGDIITIKWDEDEDDIADFEQEYNVSFILNEFEFVVSGLPEASTFDPFKEVKVKASGISGYDSEVSISNSGTPSLNFAFLDNSGNQHSMLFDVKNGDTFQIVVSENTDDLNIFCFEKYQMIPSRTSMEYTVSGLAEYVTDLSQIPYSVNAKIKSELVDILKEQAYDWSYPDSLCEITYMGNALRVYTGTENYSSIHKNEYILLFKIDVDSPIDGIFSYYYAGYVYNLLKSGSGEFSYSGPSVPIDKIWSTCYTGYKTYEEIERHFFSKESDYYTSEKNFDLSIMDKQTYIPKDPSVTDAIVALTPDDVCYKIIDDYNTIIGFSQSGYDKILSYDPTKSIKLVLPSKDSDGNDVDDVHFYANTVSGSDVFDINALISNDTCPLIYLVIPESCTRFNGFSDSSASSDYNHKIIGVQLNSGLKSIGSYAFYELKGITSITIPAGVTTIPESCFAYCSNLQTVTFLGKITSFENKSFAYCNKLVIDELRLENQVIDPSAFDYVTINHLVLASDSFEPLYYSGSISSSCNVVSIEIADGITTIPQRCFEGLKSVKEIVIPDSVVEIKRFAFSGCTDLTHITFPAKMPKIDEYAFYGCTSLVIDSLVLDEDLSLNSACFYDVTINTVTLVSNKYNANTGPANGCLEGCNVKNFVIADTVTELPSYLFYGMKLTSRIEIPSSVTYINYKTFTNFNDLTELVCGASVKSLSYDIGLNSKVIVYAPAGSKMIEYCVKNGIKYEAQ